MSTLTKTFNSQINGVENVYTQHQPLLCSVLDAFAKGEFSSLTHTTYISLA